MNGLPRVFFLWCVLLVPFRVALADKDDEVTAAHLKVIHTALSKYMKAHEGVWPQMPLDLKPGQEMDWWLKVLSPYGVKEEHLLDPRDDGKRPADRMSYAITAFDGLPNTAYRWPTQPWALTVGPSKQSGEVQLLLPDGRVLLQSEFMKIVRKVDVGEREK